MMTSLMYILLASLIPPTWATTPTRRPEGEDRRKEDGRRGRKLAQTTRAIDFSLDSDQAPDSNGSYTSATLETCLHPSPSVQPTWWRPGTLGLLLLLCSH